MLNKEMVIYNWVCRQIWEIVNTIQCFCFNGSIFPTGIFYEIGLFSPICAMFPTTVPYLQTTLTDDRFIITLGKYQTRDFIFALTSVTSGSVIEAFAWRESVRYVTTPSFDMNIHELYCINRDISTLHSLTQKISIFLLKRKLKC